MRAGFSTCVAIVTAGLFVAAGCDSAQSASVQVTPSTVRAERRAYHGAPPVIPHPPLGAACTSCHNATGIETPDLGIAPANPHHGTRFVNAVENCRQCHVFRVTDATLVGSNFQGLQAASWRGDRLYRGAPPVIPHSTLMRENCAACHTGPAARTEIICSHPERRNCVQCHVPRTTLAVRMQAAR